MNRLLVFALLGALACSGCRTANELTFASWNIGHYALGDSSASTIPSAKAAERAAAYQAFLEEVNADVFGVAEYSAAFTREGDVAADKAVFGRYSQCVVGPHNGYQWNAHFWNGYAFVSKRIEPYPVHDQNVYYVATRLKVAGEEVVFVATHLDWTTFKPGHEQDRALQMQKLIDDFKDEPRVVISGDFNVGIRSKDKPSRDNPVEYKVFEQAGYTLGTDGRYKTAPAGAPTRTLDNIIVKGFDMLEFKVFDCPTLSDHALVRARLRLK